MTKIRSPIIEINHIQDLFVKLRDIGEETLSKKWNVAMLLSSLPRSYDALITALETRSESDLTFAMAQQKLICMQNKIELDRF